MIDEKVKNQMCVGRFIAEFAAVMEEMNTLIDIEQKFYRQYIEGSLSHAVILAQTKIILQSDYEKISHSLKLFSKKLKKVHLFFHERLKISHMNIEARLSALIGRGAGHLHMAHARNDQVAVDFRLCVREAVQKVAQALKAFIKQLLALAEKHVKTFLPSFTHLQLVQPVIWSH